MDAVDGVEFLVVAYLVSDNTGLEARINISSSKFIGPIKSSIAYDLAQSKDLRCLADDFRPMTREEIADYKKRERDG